MYCYIYIAMDYSIVKKDQIHDPIICIHSGLKSEKKCNLGKPSALFASKANINVYLNFFQTGQSRRNMRVESGGEKIKFSRNVDFSLVIALVQKVYILHSFTTLGPLCFGYVPLAFRAYCCYYPMTSSGL